VFFEVFDAEGHGYLTKPQVTNVIDFIYRFFYDNHYPNAAEFVEKVFSNLDTSKRGKISFTEFENILLLDKKLARCFLPSGNETKKSVDSLLPSVSELNERRSASSPGRRRNISLGPGNSGAPSSGDEFPVSPRGSSLAESTNANASQPTKLNAANQHQHQHQHHQHQHHQHQHQHHQHHHRDRSSSANADKHLRKDSPTPSVPSPGGGETRPNISGAPASPASIPASPSTLVKKTMSRQELVDSLPSSHALSGTTSTFSKVDSSEQCCTIS